MGKCAEVDSNARADFEWFGKLGFPDVKGCAFVRAATGRWTQVGSQAPQNSYLHGFLLETNGDVFTVFLPSLVTRSFTNSATGTAEYKRVGMEAADLRKFVLEQLDSLRQGRGEDYFSRDFDTQLAERAEAFVLAWACWRQDLEAEAQELYDQTRTMPSRGGIDHADPKFRLALEKDFAQALMWRAMADFGKPSITRPELLDQFELILTNYPASEYRKEAADMAAVLRQTIREDAEHEKAGRKDLSRLPTDEKVRELIFRLRDQNVMDGGYGDILMGWRTTNTPAHQLVKLGYAAVPQLIGALDSRTPSRSVEIPYRSTYPGYVLTVGDCAEQILQRITGKSFARADWLANGRSRDQRASASRKAAETWWAEFQKKGEKQMLIEEVSKPGNEDAPREAILLREKYPDSAAAAMIRGIRAATNSSIASDLIRQLGMLDQKSGTEFLKEEVWQGPCLESRVESAFALRRREKELAMDAMIHDWQTVPEQITMNNEWEWIIDFLGTCDSPRAVAALEENLRQRLPEMRQKVVEVLGKDRDWHFEPLYTNLPPSADTLSAVERCLISELDDGDETYMSDNGSSWNPRVADLAAYYLGKRWFKRYTFDLGAPYKVRERQCIECMNIWRGAHDLSPLPFPAAPTAALPRDDAVKVTLIRWSPDSVPPAPQLSSRLAGFDGKRLDADVLVGLLADFVRDPQSDASGLSLIIAKDADLTGVQIIAALIRGKRDATVRFWGQHEVVILGTNKLHEENGGEIAGMASDPGQWGRFRNAVNGAIAGDPQVPFEIDVRVASEQP